MLVCLFSHCMRGCGRGGRPAFPAPSDPGGQDVPEKNSRGRRGEIARPYLCAVGCLKFESVTIHWARTLHTPRRAVRHIPDQNPQTLSDRGRDPRRVSTILSLPVQAALPV